MSANDPQLTSHGDKPKDAKAARSRRRLWKWLGLGVGILILLVVGLGFWATTDSFFNRIVWPIVEKQTGTEVAAGDIEFNLFSRIAIHDLQLQGPAPEGDRIAIGDVEVVYSLGSLLRGAPHFNRIAVSDVDGSITRRRDGTIALLADAPPPAEKTEEPSDPLNLVIDALDVQRVSLNLTDNATGLPEPMTAAVVLDALQGSVGLGDMVDAPTPEFELTAHVQGIRQGDHTDVTGGALHGTAQIARGSDGSMDVTSDLTLRELQGRWRGTELSGYALETNAEARIREDGAITIETTQLQVARGGNVVGRVGLTGDFNPETGEGSFDVDVTDVTGGTFELLLARPGGVDFGDSAAVAHFGVRITEGGNRIAVDASSEFSQLSALAPELASERTPPIDLILNTDLAVNLATGAVQVSRLGALGSMEGRRLLTAALDQPITISWGAQSDAQIPPAALSVGLENLDLGRVRALLPTQYRNTLRAGRLSADVQFQVAGGGAEITATGLVQGAALVLAPTPDAEPLPQLDLTSRFEILADTAQQRVNVRRAETTIVRGSQRGTLTVQGDLNLANGEGALQMRADQIDLTLPAALFADPDQIRIIAGALTTDTALTLTDGGGRVEVNGVTSWVGLDARVAAGGLGGAALPYTDGTLNHSLHMVGADVTLNESTLDLGGLGRVQMSGALAGSAPMRLTVRTEALDLAALSRLLESAMPLRIARGQVNGTTEITMNGSDLGVSFDGEAALDSWSMPDIAPSLEPVTTRGRIDLAMDSSPVMTVTLADLNMTSRGQPAGAVNGTMTMNTATAAMSFEGDVNGLSLALAAPFMPADTPGTPRSGRLTWNGAFDMENGADDLSFTAKGHSEIASLTLDATGLPEAVAEPMDVTADVDVALSMAAGAMRLQSNALTADLRRGSQALGTITARGSADLSAMRSDMTATVTDLDLGALRALMPATLAERLASGRLSYDGQVTSSGVTQMTSRGRVDLRDATINVPGSAPITGVNLHVDHDLSLTETQLAVRRAEGTLTSGDTQGSFSATADVALSPLAGTAQLTLDDVAAGGLLAAFAGEEMAAKIAGLVIDGDQTLRFDLAANDMNAAGNLSLRNAMRVDTPEGPRMLSVDLTNRAEMAGDTLTFEDTRITSNLDGFAPQTIDISGSVDLKGERPSALVLSGGTLDLTPYMDLFMGGEEPATDAPPSAEPLSITMPDIPDPGAMRVRADVLFDQIIMREIVMANPSLSFAWRRVKPDELMHEFRISRIDVELPSESTTGHLTGEIFLEQAEPGTPVNTSVNLQLTKTELGPIMRSFDMDDQSVAVGSFAMPRCQYSGPLLVIPHDFENLTGSAQFEFGDGHISHIPLLDAIVSLTGIDQLRRLQFFEGGATLRANGDHMELRPQGPFYVLGDLSVVTATGDIFYDGRQNMHIAIGLSRNFPGIPQLRDALLSGRAFPESSHYPGMLMLPLPIQTTGTWAEPRTTFGVPQFDQIIPGLVPTDRLRELLQDTPLQRASGRGSSLRDAVGGLIPGRSQQQQATQPGTEAQTTVSPQQATREGSLIESIVPQVYIPGVSPRRSSPEARRR